MSALNSSGPEFGGVNDSGGFEVAEFERVVTHRSVSAIARLMGYTPAGINELLDSCKVKQARLLINEGTHWLTEWVTIGISRPQMGAAKVERVAARFNFRTKRFEFSAGSEAHALTANAAEAKRIRREVAEEVVKRVSDTRPAISARFIKFSGGDHGVPAQETIKEEPAVSSPPTMIISPVAPRDPRGTGGAQRPHSAPRNGMSGG